MMLLNRVVCCCFFGGGCYHLTTCVLSTEDFTVAWTHQLRGRESDAGGQRCLGPFVGRRRRRRFVSRNARTRRINEAHVRLENFFFPGCFFFFCVLFFGFRIRARVICRSNISTFARNVF